MLCIGLSIVHVLHGGSIERMILLFMPATWKSQDATTKLRSQGKNIYYSTAEIIVAVDSLTANASGYSSNLFVAIKRLLVVSRLHC